MTGPLIAVENRPPNDLLAGQSLVLDKLIESSLEFLVGAHRKGHERDGITTVSITLPPKIGLSTLIDGIIHPEWSWAFLTYEPIIFANVAGNTSVGDGRDAISLAEYVGSQFDPGLSWEDVDWLRRQWDGPIVVKGIQSVEDAIIAADRGVDAIAISNHGGRQLDSTPATLDLLPAIADAVGDKTEIICDGGVRRGDDIVKAIALGADAVMAGRPYLCGLGAVGEPGVDQVLTNFASEMRRTMALIGCTNVDHLGTEYIS